jgi:predicted acetyltransferase
MSSIVGSQVVNGRPFLNPQALSTTFPPPTTAAAFTRPAGGELRLGTATAGDHYQIYDFLHSVFQAPSAGEFQAQLEEPGYEPSDRFVVRSGARIVAHLRTYRREMHFGSLLLPVRGLTELATQPECRGLRCATGLIEAAEQRMAAEAVALGIVRTTAPQLFARRGWVAWGRHSYSLAGTREILAQLSATEAVRDATTAGPMHHDPRPPQLSTRIWRHVERGALMRLYQANMDPAYGAVARPDDYWRWLISRRAYDNIYVVIEGPDKLDLNETPIIGYAVTREGRIIEMMTDRSRPYAVTQLLTRVCGDAIERDMSAMRLDASPTDPLHELLVAAGGQFRHREVDGGQVMMAKLLEPWRFLAQLSPILFQRAKESGVGLPFDLGLCIGHQRLCIEVSRRNLRFHRGRVGRSYLNCSLRDLEQLMLGHLDVTQGIQEGRLTASTRHAIHLAAILFPPLPFWRPPLDEIAA